MVEARSVSLDDVPAEQLKRMVRAGAVAIECEDALAATDHNVVTEVLRHQGEFVEWRHYPKGDVFDKSSHSQFYYHAHAAEERVEGEHGHFHTFVQGGGIAKRHRPVAIPGVKPVKKRSDLVCHVIGISMDVYGEAFRLFTTNRWVTGESWFTAKDAIRIADGFDIAHTQPSWPANRWISAMVTLFRPQIDALIKERDAGMADWSARFPDRDVYDDRELNVVSEMAISLDDQVEAVEAALADKAAE